MLGPSYTVMIAKFELIPGRLVAHPPAGKRAVQLSSFLMQKRRLFIGTRVRMSGKIFIDHRGARTA